MFVAFPFDSAKTKLQTFPVEYRGPLHCIRTTIKAQGFSGLYKGFTPGLIGNITECVVVFTAYGLWQDGIKSTFNIQSDDNIHGKCQMVALNTSNIN